MSVTLAHVDLQLAKPPWAWRETLSNAGHELCQTWRFVSVNFPRNHQFVQQSFHRNLQLYVSVMFAKEVLIRVTDVQPVI